MPPHIIPCVTDPTLYLAPTPNPRYLCHTCHHMATMPRLMVTWLHMPPHLIPCITDPTLYIAPTPKPTISVSYLPPHGNHATPHGDMMAYATPSHPMCHWSYPVHSLPPPNPRYLCHTCVEICIIVPIWPFTRGEVHLSEVTISLVYDWLLSKWRHVHIMLMSRSHGSSPSLRIL